MTEMHDNRIFNIRAIFFIALFTICSLCISKPSTSQNYSINSFGVSTELHSSKAAILDYQKISTPERAVFQNENFSIKYFNKETNLNFSKTNINQDFIVLRQNLNFIKPLILSRFYFYFHILASDDLPVLS
jgi:hypothetical protein